MADQAAALAVALGRLSRSQLLDLARDLTPDERAAVSLALRRLSTREATERHQQRAERAGAR